jgi:aspartate-semialdehyde dehydrogenase
VFFSSGDDISKEWAPQAVASGAFAVDNSAAFRMDDTKVLCVPEINAHLIDKKTPQIIANPNCSTIQLVVALKPLMDRFGLEKVVTSTYQAVSGAGQQAYDELAQQVKSWTQGQELNVQQFPHQIAFNLIPQIGSFLDNGFSSEEMKIIKETKKILGNSQIKVSAMTVRVPVLNAHSEAVWVTLTQRVALGDILSALESQKGLVLSKTGYPMPKDCSDKNPVYVGRVHQDMDDPHTWIFWVVADNIRKGAAWNGLQIAAHLFDIAI